MKTVMVTGSSGALGQALVARLLRTGDYRVIRISRRGGDAATLQVDVCAPAAMGEAVSRVKPDVVVHLAATLANDLEEAYRVNVNATRQLLDAIQRGAPGARVVLAGSAAEYGHVPAAENPVREDRVLNPVSIYGVTKAWQTQLASLYATRGVDVVVARVFNLDGPGVSEQLFVGRIRKQIADFLAGRRHDITVGSLSAVRDYVSTDEASELMLAIARYGTSGEVYHVASGIPISMRDLLNRYLAVHHLDAKIVREAPALSNRTGYDVPVIFADITKTTQLTRAGRPRAET